MTMEHDDTDDTRKEKDNVIPFRRIEVGGMSEESLQDLVKALKEDEVQAFVLIGVTKEETLWMHATEFNSRLKMIGAIRAAEHFIWDL